jgi:DNA/RNA-binding domain of Phe-tRNA-synthetase-like protein
MSVRQAIDELIDKINLLKAENEKLRQGIIDDRDNPVVLVPREIYEKLEAKNKRLRERIEELQEILHYGHIDQPLVAVIGKAMEEKRKAEQALKK